MRIGSMIDEYEMLYIRRFKHRLTFFDAKSRMMNSVLRSIEIGVVYHYYSLDDLKMKIMQEILSIFQRVKPFQK